MGAEIKEKRELWKEILDGRMDESSMPEGERWSYLEDTAGSIEEATYCLKNMALLDYITECYKTKKEVNKTISTTKLNLVVLICYMQFRPFRPSSALL